MKLSGIQLARMKGALDLAMLRGHSAATIVEHRLGIVTHELTWQAEKDGRLVVLRDADIERLRERIEHAPHAYARATFERQLKDTTRWREQAARDAKRARASLAYLKEHGLPHEVATYMPGCGSAVSRAS